MKTEMLERLLKIEKKARKSLYTLLSKLLDVSREEKDRACIQDLRANIAAGSDSLNRINILTNRGYSSALDLPGRTAVKPERSLLELAQLLFEHEQEELRRLKTYHWMTRLESSETAGKLSSDQILSADFKFALEGGIPRQERQLLQGLFKTLRIKHDGHYLSQSEGDHEARRAEIIAQPRAKGVDPERLRLK